MIPPRPNPPPKIKHTKRYVYFVSFFATRIGNPNRILGNAEFSLRDRISNIDDIAEMERYVEEKHDVTNVKVISYQLLRKEKK